jgi:alcohol dehydrogenase (cytochrome c)
VPQKKGDPGSDTWSNEEVMKHGGGMTWQPVTYDPELNLIFVSTGNPQPVVAFANRMGANLFTGSIVALHGDTGTMAWYFQSSPQDTHDWDSTQPAIVYDATIEGRPRKLIAQAARNGHFFILDRTNGKAIVSTEFVKTNWSKGYDEKGQPIPNPEKRPTVSGTLTSPAQGGGTNWNSPSLSPLTGLFYINASQSYSVYYIYDASTDPAGWGGTDRGGYSTSMLQAIDSTTGKIRWSHPWYDGQRSGLLSTAGNVLFTGGSGGLTALNATTGEALWNTRIGIVSNGPITYELDGRQYVVVGNGTRLLAFVMNR